MQINMYQEKAYDLLLNEGEKVGRLLGNIKKKQYEDKCSAVDLSFVIGFENGCLMKDEDEKNNINKIKRFDSMKLVGMIENVTPLIKYLKNNVDDILVKGRVIEQLGILANYIADICIDANKESEEVK